MNIQVPKTTERVEQHTKDEINERMEKEIEQNIEYYRDKSPDIIKNRIDELESEWDTERVLEANASTLVLAASVLSLSVNKKWSLLSGIVGGFLLQHAIQGWCPPLSIIRRAGVRTAAEINKEKTALDDVLKNN
ncbi:YgaP family membrane protein [Bacillus piscicola]|uniref:YgaP family membrane protein n=1 Tax=Bacillus piscicola TaxID=1632684 RepID=UPI001F08DEA1|nr:DUF2892 domain-containing protein [Bacillus piscicola]